ncbi:hypothetical protein YPPY53_1653, partial [Yersinia pestis PY-53]
MYQIIQYINILQRGIEGCGLIKIDKAAVNVWPRLLFQPLDTAASSR